MKAPARSVAADRRDALGVGLVLALSALALALAPAFGTATPLLFGIGSLAFAACAVSIRIPSLLPRTFLVVLGIGLVGYAFLGRSFAYLGAPPLYVGEALLAVGLLALVIGGRLRELVASPLAWLLVGFMAIGLVGTIPYLPRYGLDSLRDAVVWGYGAFSIIVAAALLRTGWAAKVPRLYERFLPAFLLWAPLVIVLELVVGVTLPTVPGTDDVAWFSIKRGDAAVHLAGALAFLTLGLHRRVSPAPAASIERREWLLWAFWLAGFAAASTARAAILTVLVAFVVLVILRPTRHWAKLALVTVLAGTLFVGFEIELPADRNRSISAQEMLLAVQSIATTGTESGYDGTRAWRLDWWSDIVDYTVFGPYFWEGKGYGVNLATDDGYQSHVDDSLRSPHNGHMTILARSGVPGAVAWLLLQGAFGLALLRFHLRHRRSGRAWEARLALWVLVYWIAFLTNASFDVFLEGPQGGIWFWCLFGFGLALLSGGAPAPRPRPAADADVRRPEGRPHGEGIGGSEAS